MELDSIMVRRCGDDFEAFQVANALQGMVGVDVMSVVFQPMIIGDDRWHVFAKHDSSLHSPTKINKVINEAIDDRAAT